MQEPLEFKVGDEVRLTPSAAKLYGQGPSQGLPGGRGRIIHAALRPNDPLRPYLVQWESDPNGYNSYREEDLMLAQVAPPEPASNIIPFGGIRRS